MGVSWQAFEAAAPSMAAPARERLGTARVALLATLRRDGTPRISPIEPYFAGGQLLLGAMVRSLKAGDLLRDPRCVVHSPVVGPDTGDPEFKLRGEAVPAEPVPADTGWWVDAPAGSARVFALRIESAASIDWDLGGGRMTVRIWSPERGVRTETRAYP